MVSATNGLYWGFHNIQYRRHGLSRLYDNGFFSEDLGCFKKSVYKPHPNFGGQILFKKSAAYTLANTVIIFNQLKDHKIIQVLFN
jgi:hypothetical protein